MGGLKIEGWGTTVKYIVVLPFKDHRVQLLTAVKVQDLVVLNWRSIYTDNAGITLGNFSG